MQKAVNKIKMDSQTYYNILLMDSQNRKPDETIANMKVIYQDDLHDYTHDLGALIPIVSMWTFEGVFFKPKDIKEHYVVLDKIFKYAHKELKEAAVEHEKVHKKYPCLHDRNDEEMKLIVNTIAFMESRNPLCVGLPYICPELHSIKDTEKIKHN